jgi:ABC-2 type transport system ATP-binding protein
MEKCSIEIKNLSKHYSDEKRVYEVLSDVNFKIDKFGLYALKGESGSGKSTLIKILSGQLDCDEGTVIINNKDVTSFSNDEWIIFKRTSVSCMPQENYFDNSHTVEENIKFLCNSENIHFPEEKYLNLIDLFKLPNRKIKYLSNGEKQIALFIYTILTAKEVLILDEPTSSLDEENSIRIWDYLKQFSNDHLILVSSNKESEIDKYCDKHICIEEQKVRIRNNPLVINYDLKKESNCLIYETKSVFYHGIKKLQFLYKRNVLYLLFLVLFTLMYLFFIGLYLDKIYVDNSKHIIHIKNEATNMEINNEVIRRKTIDYSISYDNFYQSTISNNDLYKEYDESYMVYSFEKYDKKLYYKGSNPKSRTEIAISKRSRYKIGDTVFLNTLNGKYELQVVGLLENDAIILEKEITKEISDFSYIIDKVYLSFGSLHYSNYKLSNETIEDSKIVVYTPSNLIKDINNKDVYFYDDMKEMDVEIKIDESLEGCEVVLGKDILNILLDSKKDGFITGRIAGYKDYLSLKKELGDGYEIIYDYLNSAEIAVNKLNRPKLYEVLLYLVSTIILIVLMSISSRLVNKQSRLLIYYNNLFSTKIRRKVFRVEKGVLLVFFLVTFGFLCLILKNLYFFQMINQSNIVYFYYFTCICIVTLFLFKIRGDKHDKV